MANTAPVKFTTAFTMRVDQEFLDAIEELRALARPVPTKSELIRRVIMAEVQRRKKARA